MIGGQLRSVKRLPPPRGAPSVAPRGQAHVAAIDCVRWLLAVSHRSTGTSPVVPCSGITHGHNRGETDVNSAASERLPSWVTSYLIQSIASHPRYSCTT